MTDLKIMSIKIDRGYSATSPFTAAITVKGQYYQTEIRLDEQRTLAIIDQVMDLIVDGASALASIVRADASNSMLALEAVNTNAVVPAIAAE